MTYTRYGLKALGLSFLAALGLLAIMASGAQAEWKIGGVKITEEETVSSSAQTPSTFTVPTLGLQIACSGLESHGGKVLTNQDNDYGRHLYNACSTTLSGEEIPACKPLEPIVGEHTGHLILSGSLSYLLVEPNKNEKGESLPFAVIKFPEKCALAGTFEIKGSVVFECLNEKAETGAKLCETEMVTHLFQPAPEKLFPEDKLTFGKSPMLLGGISTLKLSGKNAGKKWSGGI